MGKTYRSAQGKMVDMEALLLKNELVPAIGNMRVNARGDQLGPGGKIVKTRDQIMAEYYDANIGKRTRHSGKASDLKADAMQAVPNRNRLPTVPGINDQFEVKPTETSEDQLPAITTATNSNTELRGGLAQAIAKADQARNQNQ